MSTSKNHRRGREENRRARLVEKSLSFHGQSLGGKGEKLLRPRTLPDLLSGSSFAGVSLEARPKLTKLLLNVTIQRSSGAVQVVMSPDATVGDLIAAALQQYGKEGRRPILTSTDSSGFGLHYSQFSLESLDRGEKLMTLGSRNFFLCSNKSATESGGGSGSGSDDGGGGVTTQSSSSCSKEAEVVTKIGVPWLKFMNFLF